MREPLEMVTVSRMQKMVEIRKKNTYFVTILLFLKFWKKFSGALGVESPHGGAIKTNDTTHINGTQDSTTLKSTLSTHL